MREKLKEYGYSIMTSLWCRDSLVRPSIPPQTSILLGTMSTICCMLLLFPLRSAKTNLPAYMAFGLVAVLRTSSKRESTSLSSSSLYVPASVYGTSLRLSACASTAGSRCSAKSSSGLDSVGDLGGGSKRLTSGS